jgi:hypothetical protein
MTPPGRYGGWLVVSFTRLVLKIELDFLIYYSIRKSGRNLSGTVIKKVWE